MYSFDSTVRYSETDESAHLSVLGLINYLQDCSTFQACSLGRDFDYMRKNGFAWLLAAWGIEIVELPAFADHIRISTWAKSHDRMFGTRCFTVTGDSGDVLVRAESLWFLFDTERNRPLPMREEEFQAYLDPTAPDLGMRPIKRRIPVEGEGSPRDAIVVSRAYLDTNHHVNNAQYVEMALAALDDQKAHGKVPRRIDVQYCTAAVLGDVIVPSVHMTEDGCVVNLTNEAGRSYAVVRLRV
jgi:acyl-ACP thioesterase